jgi:hypothetical protein
MAGTALACESLTVLVGRAGTMATCPSAGAKVEAKLLVLLDD